MLIRVNRQRRSLFLALRHSRQLLLAQTDQMRLPLCDGVQGSSARSTKLSYVDQEGGVVQLRDSTAACGPQALLLQRHWLDSPLENRSQLSRRHSLSVVKLYM